MACVLLLACEAWVLVWLAWVLGVVLVLFSFGVGGLADWLFCVFGCLAVRIGLLRVAII